MSLGENLPRGIRENSPKRGGLCITHAGRHPTTGPQHTKLACALIITAPSLERCMGLRSYLVGDSVSNIPLSSFLTDFFKHPFYIITYIYVQSYHWVIIICDHSWGTALRKCWNLPYGKLQQSDSCHNVKGSKIISCLK